MPDDVVFVDDIPLGATGKIDKKLIRERFAGLRAADRQGGGVSLQRSEPQFPNSVLSTRRKQCLRADA